MLLSISPNKGTIDSTCDTIDSSSDTTNPELFTHMEGSRFTMNQTYDANMSIQSGLDPIKKSPTVQSSKSNEITSPNVSEDKCIESEALYINQPPIVQSSESSKKKQLMFQRS